MSIARNEFEFESLKLRENETIEARLSSSYHMHLVNHNIPYHGSLFLTNQRIIFFSSLITPYYQFIDYENVEFGMLKIKPETTTHELIVSSQGEKHYFEFFSTTPLDSMITNFKNHIHIID
ncbi:GRAM domain-containing protein [Terrilactibacillus laevilacticus]|uniref:GRAM domain-containing protein n=1 Tax=Terrilactibacillus laevilacticus TaxID=1380157 RepID=A0ABW5PVB9_9BACI|nr:GRAM domain-containing protein [Terrilactibacillus laevilacticus]